MKALADKSVEYATWYLSLDDNRFLVSDRECQYHLSLLDTEVKLMRKYNSQLVEIYEEQLGRLYHHYVERMGYNQ